MGLRKCRNCNALFEPPRLIFCSNACGKTWYSRQTTHKRVIEEVRKRMMSPLRISHSRKVWLAKLFGREVVEVEGIIMKIRSEKIESLKGDLDV